MKEKLKPRVQQEERKREEGARASTAVTTPKKQPQSQSISPGRIAGQVNQSMPMQLNTPRQHHQQIGNSTSMQSSFMNISLAESGAASKKHGR